MNDQNCEAIMICSKCRFFVQLKKIFRYKGIIFVEYNCNCFKKNKKMALEKFINYFSLKYKYILKTSTKLKIAMMNQKEIKYVDFRKNQYIIKYRTHVLYVFAP